MITLTLILKSLFSRQVNDVQVPFNFTFKQLEDLLSERFSSSTYPSSATVRRFYFPDCVTDFHSYNPDDTLSSSDVTSHISLLCDLFAPGIQGHNIIAITILVQDSKENRESSAVREIVDGETLEAKEGDQSGPSDVLENCNSLDMDIEKPISESGKGFSVTPFLRRIFRELFGDSEVGDHSLIAVAVHAVLIESGFIYYDPVSHRKIEGFHLPNELFSSSQTLSFWYTLPLITDEKMETVVLKFQGFGKYLTIYGSLTKNGCRPYWVRVDKSRVRFNLNLVWANLDLDNKTVEREVFKFWKTIKDNLVLPLSIDLCERAGLAPPACFSFLSPDIKFQILKSLSGTDIARAACVCSELRSLSSDEDLWKEKYEEEFGSGKTTTGKWKEEFAKSCEAKNRLIRGAEFRRCPMTRNWAFQGWGSRRSLVAVPGSESGFWSPRRSVVAEPRSGYGSGSGSANVGFYQRRGVGYFVPNCNLGGPSL